MVKLALGLSLFLSWCQVSIGQSWTHVAFVPLPTIALPEEEWPVKLSLYDDLLAIGSPDWQGRGVVMVHERNTGGSNSWEVMHLLEGHGLDDAFGRDLTLNDLGLFVASESGLWHHIFSSEMVLESLVTGSNTWALAVANSPVVASGPLILGSEATVLKYFLPGTESDYLLASALAVQPTTTSLATCLGNVLTYDPPHLIVSDPCWRTTNTIPVSGLVKVFQTDPILDTIWTDTQSTFGGAWPFGEGYPLGMNFGRALELKGDTLFIGFGPSQSGVSSHVEVFQANGSNGWDRFKQIHVPEDWTGPEIGDLGTALVSNGNELFIGTDHGLAFYQEVDTAWVFQHFEPLGGAVSSISVDRDLLAVAVPTMGAVHIYERTATSIAKGSPDIASMRVAPNPAARKTTILPFHATCQVRTLLHTDALGRILEQLPWDGMKPLELEVDRDLSGTTFIKALDVHGWTCATGRVSWIAQ